MDLEELIAERAIYCKLVAFARAMDDRDWQALDTITTDNIISDVGTGRLQGRAALVENMRAFLDDCGPTQHLLANILIDVDGNHASSKAYVSDMHLSADANSEQTFCTLGDYHDKWQKINNEWFMSQRVKQNRAHIGSFEVLGSGPENWRA